jgi:formate hydrogenlyase subunit 3/multisubunit Na+/H+ antiporter MnhD subunit
MSGLLVLAPLLPALLAVAMLAPQLRRHLEPVWPLAALPALVVAVLLPTGTVIQVPWLLLGAGFGLGAVQRVLLLLTAILWTAAGIYASSYHRGDPARTRLVLFFLVTMTGNLGLVLAADLVGFYFFFGLMSFSAYGLVIHRETAEARRAGLVYIVLVIAGEAFLLPAIWYLGATAPSLALADMAATVAEAGDLVTLCLLVGFGIKAGALPLHVWLPLAHPVAPTPASAVLSGAMIKAGLLGWLHLLPLGQQPLDSWAALLTALGVAAAFYGVILGLAQDRAKTLLAYSSISQMGLVTIAVGTALLGHGPSRLAVPAALAYAFHHGLAKGALFLGVGVVEHAGKRRRAALPLLLLPALALAGAPLTSGALAKTALKQAAAAAPWYPWLDLLLPLAALGTTLLMARFMALMLRAETHEDTGLFRLWLPLIAAVVVLPWLPPIGELALIARTFAPDSLLVQAWPVAVGIALGGIVWRRPTLLGPLRHLRLPAGDLLVPGLAVGRRCLPLIAFLAPVVRAPGRPPRLRLGAHLERLQGRLAAAEQALQGAAIATAVLLLVVLALMLGRL